MWLEVLLGCCLVFCIYKATQKPARYPPGKWGVPFFGSLPSMRVPFERQLLKLREKHGDIFIWRIGTTVNVFISDFFDMKEVFAKEEFSDRPNFEIFNFSTDGEPLGVVASNGPVWQNSRRFAMRHLRDLGMGRSSMSDAIHFEARKMAKSFISIAGEPVHLERFINVAVLNVVWQLVASQRYELDDPTLLEFQQLIADVQSSLTPRLLPDVFPWLTKILPSFVQDWLFRRALMGKIFSKLKEFYYALIDEHKANFDPSNPRDYIDAYLCEMEAHKDDPDNTFRIDCLDLFRNLHDFFSAGSESVAATLRWLLLYLAKYPDVQEKVQKEIDQNLPRDVLPTWDERTNSNFGGKCEDPNIPTAVSAIDLMVSSGFPYTEAVIHEIHRHASPLSMAVPHFASKDMPFKGYIIPKNAVVYSFALCAHYDRKFWSEPEVFRPKRFINAEGKFTAQRDGFLPFGIGRRQCLGESLARMELFIFTVAILQSLHFAPIPGVEVDLGHIEGNPLVRLPRTQKLLITVRE